MASNPRKKRARKKQAEKRRKKRVDEPKRVAKYKVTIDDSVIRDKPDYEVLSARDVTLDIDKAYIYADLTIFRGERDVEQAHVIDLFEQMRNSSFEWHNVTIATCELDGRIYKINGQHTCWALIGMCDEVNPNYKAEVREVRYRVTTRDNLKAVYRMYDRGKPRTDAHLTKTRLVDTPLTEGIWTSNINLMTSALKFWKFEQKNQRAKYKDDTVAPLIEDNEVPFKCAAYILQENSDMIENVKRQPVIAAIMATYEKVPTVAGDFWQPVIDGLNMTSKTDPRYALRKCLNEVALSSSFGSKKRILSPETLYRICVSAWNKWRKGEEAKVALRATNSRVKPV